MEEKRISIIDVAKAAGVSTATVSRVINQMGGYSQKTEKKVLDTIKACGFRPNASAIGLRTKKSHSVGVIVPDITNEFFAKIVRVLNIFFLKYNYSIFICDLNEDAELEERHIQDMLDKNVDGLIFVSGKEATSPLLKQAKIPTVFIDRSPKDAEITVRSDNYQGGYLAGHKLHECGCEKILFIRDYRMTSTVEQRRQGFMKAMEECGNVCQGEYEIGILSEYKAVREKMSNLLAERGCYFDGIFATNDIMALGAMHALREAGYMVPSQVKLIGFDNVSFTEFCNPPMTTIAQNTEQIGLYAGEALIKLMRNEYVEQKSYIVPVHLEMRSTT